jgi:signal transduction histidine kinase
VTRTTRAVDSLSSTAQEFARGHLQVRADTATFNEIADVGDVFNTMAQRLSATIRELENQAQEAQTARVKAERSDQVKSAFLASMSHELRTPLNSIINFSKFVVRGVMGPVTERQEETLNKVVASGQHLLSLINDVLDMSKIESGSLNLFVEDDVDVKAIVETVVNNSQSLLAEKPVSLRTELPAELPSLRGDKKRLTQILFNLVSNACKFTEQGSVVISARQENQELVLLIKDTGPGIAEEDRIAVFEAFKQTRSGLRSGEGTGLGMPISKSLVEAHGGRLWFDSVVGQGTSFYVSLPIKSEQLVPISS